jgi:type I restriction enzyme M protein
MPKTKNAKKQTSTNGKPRKHATQQSVDQAVKSICDIMRRGGCAGALQYVPELTWILFLRILDEREAREQEEVEAVGVPFRASLEAPYRWQDWAAPGGPKRIELTEADGSTLGSYFAFVNGKLLPYLKALKSSPDASPRQKVISEILTGVERVRIDTERNFRDVLDKVHELSLEAIDPTHVFTLSQVYEGLLLKMGEKGNDAGQFFTPREVIRAMVQVIDPEPGEIVCDPCCGTGGFLAQSFEHVHAKLKKSATGDQLESLKQHSFWGREKDDAAYPIALANLVLHGFDKPNLWHGNTLTGHESYGGLWQGAPVQFDVVLTNPPFGGKEGKEAQTNFAYKTGSTQVLFLQHVIDVVRDEGRCGIVLDEGLLFRTNEDAFVSTKRKLLDDCDLWCILSLPGGVFTNAGAGVKTNLLFFTKGRPTKKIWYYDLSDLKILKKSPLTIAHFADFLKRLPKREDSDQSWTVDMQARRQQAAAEAEPFDQQAHKKDQESAQWKEKLAELKKAKSKDTAALLAAEEQMLALAKEARALRAKAADIRNAAFDLKAVNPNKKSDVDERTPEQLLDIIEAKGKEIAEALKALRAVKG